MSPLQREQDRDPVSPPAASALAALGREAAEIHQRKRMGPAPDTADALVMDSRLKEIERLMQGASSTRAEGWVRQGALVADSKGDMYQVANLIDHDHPKYFDETETRCNLVRLDGTARVTNVHVKQLVIGTELFDGSEFYRTAQQTDIPAVLLTLNDTTYPKRAEVYDSFAKQMRLRGEEISQQLCDILATYNLIHRHHSPTNDAGSPAAPRTPVTQPPAAVSPTIAAASPDPEDNSKVLLASRLKFNCLDKEAETVLREAGFSGSNWNKTPDRNKQAEKA